MRTLVNETDELIVHLDAPLPERLMVGRGDVLYLSGRCYHPVHALRALAVTVDGVLHPVRNHSSVRADVPSDDPAVWDRTPNSLTSGFWAVVPVRPPAVAGAIEVGCRAELADGTRREATLGRVYLEAGGARDPRTRDARPDVPRVAICLFAHDPDPESLAAQVDSLVAQDHRNWCCIVSDDGSVPERLRVAEELAARDPRFCLIDCTARVGRYDDVARTLAAVPPDVDFVALCEQGDVWPPDELSRSLAAFAGNTNLVCAGERVPWAGMRLASGSCVTRLQDAPDLAALIFAGTATDAVSTFRAALLDDVLPFPARIGDASPVHWIACAALARGTIAWIDRPRRACSSGRQEAVGSAPASATRRVRATLTGLERSIALPHRRRRFMSALWRSRDDYVHGVTRMIVIAKVLRLRVGSSISPEKRAVLDRIAELESAPWRLAREVAVPRPGGRMASNAAWRCLGGFLAARLLDVHYRRHRRRLFAERQARRDITGSGPVPDALAGVALIERKIAPLTLHIDSAEPRRVNLLAPALDFQHLFAGYLGKLHLALRLADAGHRVRIVAVDASAQDPTALRRSMASYPGLEALFDRIEIADASDRSVPLVVGAGDAFVATTWWTAHLAHGASRALGRRRFLYLIQEYEPMTFPMGSLHAFASASYDLPHAALFSTEMLRDWFRAQRIGVFADGGDSFAFQNAIARFTVVPERLRRSGPRKVLFYARPEQHAARNMFELGVLALRAACAEGAFRDDWAIDGIGAGRAFAPVRLAGGHRMQMLPRVSLSEYQLLLPGYDVGLALMLTPHPSLVPLEMAAAGLVTVTNTFANKTADALRALSTNLVPVAPTLAGIVEGLREAERAARDLEARAAGADVAWSRDWRASFDDDLLRRLSAVLAPA